MNSYWMPTKPYTIIDCLNRAALATGSCRNAMAGSFANYNGHRVTLEWNTYRQYYVGVYMWSGPNWVVRGERSFETALDSCIKFYNSDGLGSELIIHPHTDDDDILCIERGLQIYNDDAVKAHNATWRNSAFDCVHEALGYERRMGVPSSLIIGCTSDKEYYEKLDEFLKERRKNT